MDLELNNHERIEQIYWLSPKTWLIATDPRAEAIRRFPRRFGLDDRLVIATYRHYGSVDGSALEELINLALKKGWVRIVHYGNPLSHIHIQCHDFSARAELIREFLRKLVDEHAALSTAGLYIQDTLQPRRPICRSGAGAVNTFLVDGLLGPATTSGHPRRV